MQQHQWTPAQLAYVIQFQHPQKTLGHLPGARGEIFAALFDVSPDNYAAIRQQFADNARNATEELLGNRAFATLIDRLPFSTGSAVVGLGDSITDDLQSWLEILRWLLALQRPNDHIRVINAGISGDTTSQMISRFLAVVPEQPEWILCMAGTNDCRLHGLNPTKTLVSTEETGKNLAMLRHFATTQTQARWLALTPAPVIEEMIGKHWFLGPMQMQWRNSDLAAVADIVRAQPEPYVDLQECFGTPPAPDMLLDDGLHPSLDGQKLIVRAVVENLSAQDHGTVGR